MKSNILYIFILLLFGFFSQSQNKFFKSDDWQIKPVINSGFIAVHRATIAHLVKGYPTIYELSIAKPTDGSKLWHLENNKPDVGISMQCMDFKNPTQLGYAFSIVPFIEIPLQKDEKISRLILRLSWGATYLNKSFDIHKNPKNIAAGVARRNIVGFYMDQFFLEFPYTGLAFSKRGAIAGSS